MYEQVNPDQNLAGYTAQLVETLLRDMVFSVRKTLKNPDEENIHDLRVLCLRLRYALRLFARLLPRKPARKIRKRLAALQDLLAAVRCCDIASQVLGVESIAAAVLARQKKRLAAELGQARRRAVRPLQLRLKKMQRADSLQRWRSRLIPPA